MVLFFGASLPFLEFFEEGKTATKIGILNNRHSVFDTAKVMTLPVSMRRDVFEKNGATSKSLTQVVSRAGAF